MPDTSRPDEVADAEEKDDLGPDGPGEAEAEAERIGEPGGRQAGESLAAYAAFSVYREMAGEPGGRSLRAVGRRLGKSRALVERWSRAWCWQARARAFDEHRDGLLRRRLEQSWLNDQVLLSEAKSGAIRRLADALDTVVTDGLNLLAWCRSFDLLVRADANLANNVAVAFGERAARRRPDPDASTDEVFLGDELDDDALRIAAQKALLRLNGRGAV